MAATCSESGLKAMSNAMQLQDKSTIHTVDGIGSCKSILWK